MGGVVGQVGGQVGEAGGEGGGVVGDLDEPVVGLGHGGCFGF